MNPIKKYKSFSIQAKAGLWFVFCSFFQKGISFITVPIFTRLLTTDEYGSYSLYLSWLQIITIFTSLNLFNGVMDNGMSKFDKDRDKFIAAMQGLTITITTFVFVIYCVAYRFWSTLLGLAPVYIFLMFSELYVKPSMLFWSARQRFEYKYAKLVIVTMLKSILNPSVGLLLVYLMKDNALARVISVVSVELFFSIVILISQFMRGKVFLHKHYWKYGLTLAIPMLPHYLAGTILNQGDRIMIEKMVDKSSVAFYSVAYSIGMLVQMFTSAINSAITPWVYGKMKNRSDDGVARTFNGLLLFVAGICVCLMIISPELMLVFGSSSYASGAYVIPPVAASVYFIFMYFLLSLPQFYYEETRFLFIASLSAAVLNIILNYFFIKQFGYVAAGYTTLLCYVFYSMGHYIVSTKVLKKHMKDKKFFDKKTILFISIVLITISLTINFIFEYRFIRLAILLVGIVIVFLKRQSIISLVSNKK